MMSNGSCPGVRAACTSSRADGAHPFLTRGALKSRTGHGGRTFTVEIGRCYKPGLEVCPGRAGHWQTTCLLHFGGLELESESVFSGSASRKPALYMIYLPLTHHKKLLTSGRDCQNLLEAPLEAALLNLFSTTRQLSSKLIVVQIQVSIQNVFASDNCVRSISNVILCW